MIDIDINPRVKLLMRLRKPLLVCKARELKIDFNNCTKEVLAEKIALKQEIEAERIWRAIADGPKS